MTANLLTLRRGLLEAIISRPLGGVVIVDDSIAQATATELEFANHDPEVGIPFAGESIVKHASSQSSIYIASNKAYNASGSLRALYYYNIDPATVDVTVFGDFQILDNTQGNNSGVVARLDPVLNSYYSLVLVPANTGPAFNLVIQKTVSGTVATLDTEHYTLGSQPTVGDRIKIWLACSNDEKVGYIQGPGDAQPIRLCHSGDNSIPGGGGFAGVTMLRSAHLNGQHLKHFTLTANGPQAPSAQSASPTPDPIQAPQLLKEFNYSAATTTVSDGTLSGIWFREQEPYVRGVKQTTRLQVVTGSDVPGSGPYKPSTGALEATVGPWNPTTLNVAVTSAATAAATTLTMSSGDASSLVNLDAIFNLTTGEKLRVNGTPSGTSVPVLRAQRSTAQPIGTGDTLQVITGDVNDSGSLTNADFTSRAEVYDRFATNPDGSSFGSQNPLLWPDPVGSIRWYGISIYCDPSNYPTSGAGNPWGPIQIQWKGQFGGSPPRAIEHRDGHYFLAGTRTPRDLGPLPLGVWKRYVFGFRWDTDNVNGWTQAYVNDVLVAPKAYQSTMDKHSGGADPIYLKDGIYRSAVWGNVTHRVWIGPVKIGTTLADVANP